MSLYFFNLPYNNFHCGGHYNKNYFQLIYPILDYELQFCLNKLQVTIISCDNI